MSHREQGVFDAHQKLRARINKYTSTTLEFPDFDDVPFESINHVVIPMYPPQAKGVFVVPCFSSDKKDIFYTFYEPDGFIETHIHSKRYEAIGVLSGLFYDEINDVWIKEGETYIIHPKKPHRIISSPGGIITVIFSENIEDLNMTKH